VENRTRKSPEHSFGRHDGALFNSLLGYVPPALFAEAFRKQQQAA
jgi:hypothetical protein